MDQLKLLIFITKRQSHDSLDVKKESLRYVVLLQCGGEYGDTRVLTNSGRVIQMVKGRHQEQWQQQQRYS